MARATFAGWGFREIRTHVLESTDLFAKGLVVTSAVVHPEMYTCQALGSRSRTLRPEGTAPVVRALLTKSFLRDPLSKRLYYMGPMFRYERP